MTKTNGRRSRSEALRGLVRQDPITDISDILDADSSVGREIKFLRKATDFTLTQLATATNLSQGYLSQIERGQSSPSIKALHSISRALGVNISWFFNQPDAGNEELADFIVRHDKRRKLDFESGITDELLSPHLGRGIELLRCTFAPHSYSGEETYVHRGEEAGIVVLGTLTLWLEGREIILSQGDSFAFESTLPHRYANLSDEETIIIWAISPPSY